MSREQPSITDSSGQGAHNRPDYGNRHYFHSSHRGAAARHDFTPSANIKEGLDTSKVIKTLSQITRPSAPECFPIDNVKYVASYNWVDAEKPMIAAPGSPAIWTGCAVPFKLEPDPPSVFVSRDGVRLPEYPMLPLFVAADAIHGPKEAAELVDWPTVDVVTGRNSLRKLLRWLSPSSQRKVRDFRIDVQLVGNKTLVLGRWDGGVYEPPTGLTYGFGFEDATTRAAPGCPPSGQYRSHHRVIAYDMLDIKMVVRCEVDAYLPSPGSDIPKTETVDDLADTLGDMAITSATTKTSSSSLSPVLNVIRAGTQVPQEALVELISRSAYYLDQLDWNELYPQLALSQTQALHMGVHDRGVFTQLHEWQLDGRPPGATTSAPDISAQRRETAVQIVRLARLLEYVQDLAIERGSGPAGSFSLVCENGELRVYARQKDAGAKSCLPPDVVARFEARRRIQTPRCTMSCDL